MTYRLDPINKLTQPLNSLLSFTTDPRPVYEGLGLASEKSLMKILVVGCGKVGSEIARDLAGSDEVDSVVVMDSSSQNLKLLRKRVPKKIQTVRLSISQKTRLH